MKKIKIVSVVGARPNFIKIAPLVKALDARADALEQVLVHTGQHYDRSMSGSFFDELAIPSPDVNLGVGPGSHAEQVGHTMIAFEPILEEIGPDWVVVVGDVNATCACSLTAAKAGIPVAHIEAGLRSHDQSMPEEINRIVTDRLSSLLFASEISGEENLLAEGVAPEKIRHVGNIMIDTLEKQRHHASILDLSEITGTPDLAENAYALLTLHRPANVDDPEVLTELVRFLVDTLSQEIPLVWPMHPRTRSQLAAASLWDTVCSAAGITLLEPLSYRELLRLNMGARIMLTDSGGLQEECCVLGTPCITLRENTERPRTLRENGGTSELAGNRPAEIQDLFRKMKDYPRKECRPPLWDGQTAERIVACLVDSR